MNFPEVFLGSLSVSSHADRNSDYVYHLNECTIYVKNIAYNKRVGIRLLDKGLWRDFFTDYTTSLMTSGGSTIEVWKLNTDKTDCFLKTSSDRFKPPLRFQFAVFYYNLDWNTWYWDNNNSQDYFA